MSCFHGNITFGNNLEEGRDRFNGMHFISGFNAEPSKRHLRKFEICIANLAGIHYYSKVTAEEIEVGTMDCP